MDIIESARGLGMVFKEEVVVYTGTADVRRVGESSKNSGSEEPSHSSNGEGADGDRNAGENSEQKEVGEMLQVTIPPRFSLDSIGALLQEEGVIKDRIIFTELADELKVARKIQAGVYRFPRRGDSFEVLKILLKGGEKID